MGIRFATISLLLPTLLASLGCSVLLGNVKPLTEKAEGYEIADLSDQNADWARLESEEIQEPDRKNHENATDIAYQSQRTASIISLNSACRTRVDEQPRSLRDFTELLLMGITNQSYRDERTFAVQETPALETTVEGTLNGELMKVRTVVLRRGRCVYDLMYVSRPHTFEEQGEAFSRFVASLRFD